MIQPVAPRSRAARFGSAGWVLALAALSCTGRGGGGIAGGADGSAADDGRSIDGATGDGMAPDASATPPPDAMPPVVGDCTALGPTNQWQQINPADAYLGSFTLDPVHVGTVWYTGKRPGPSRGLYKSTDCGHSWAKANTGVNGDAVDMSSTWSMAIDFTDPDIMYVIGAYGAWGVWKSTNGGVDWRQTMAPGGTVANVVPAGPSSPTLAFIGSISMDPTDARHLVAGTHSTCKPPYDPSCQAESLDGGDTWTIVNVQPYSKGFLEQTGPFVLDASTWLNATLGDGLWLTTDRGKSWANVTVPGTTGATGGEYTHKPFVPAPDGTYYLPSYGPGGLLMSKDRGRNWTRVPNAPQGSYEAAYAVGGGNIYLGDLKSGSIQYASLQDPTRWTALPTPAFQGSGGVVALDYDEAHHLLYAGIWATDGELWRIVTP
jgi:photosystem II stability/assembly factor-like uncharacterized protein